MKFIVPQFIDVEDKIFGPLTLKQSIYIAGAIGVCVMLFLRFGFLITFLFGAPVLFISFLLSFVKIHGRPFISIVSSAFFYITKSKLYLWKKAPTKKKLDKNKELSAEKETRPASVELSQSNLKKLAWSLDTSNPFEDKHK